MKLSDAISTGLDILKTVITEPEASEELQKERRDICRPCPFQELNNRRCGFCKCWLPIKRAYEKYHCPLNPPKW